jgi:hypothetical protein
MLFKIMAFTLTDADLSAQRLTQDITVDDVKQYYSKHKALFENSAISECRRQIVRKINGFFEQSPDISAYTLESLLEAIGLVKKGREELPALIHKEDYSVTDSSYYKAVRKKDLSVQQRLTKWLDELTVSPGSLQENIQEALINLSEGVYAWEFELKIEGQVRRETVLLKAEWEEGHIGDSLNESVKIFLYLTESGRINQGALSIQITKEPLNISVTEVPGKPLSRWAKKRLYDNEYFRCFIQSAGLEGEAQYLSEEALIGVSFPETDLSGWHCSNPKFIGNPKVLSEPPCPEDFPERITEYLARLWTLESGKAFIQELQSMGLKILYTDGHSEYSAEIQAVKINVEAPKSYWGVVLEDGVYMVVERTEDSAVLFAHELLHAWHNAENIGPLKDVAILDRTGALLEQEEAFTIRGNCTGEQRGLCEGAILRELGLPIRLLHDASKLSGLPGYDADSQAISREVLEDLFGDNFGRLFL